MHQRSNSWVLTVCLYSLLIKYISSQAFLLSLSKIPLWCQAMLSTIYDYICIYTIPHIHKNIYFFVRGPDLFWWSFHHCPLGLTMLLLHVAKILTRECNLFSGFDKYVYLFFIAQNRTIFFWPINLHWCLQISLK